MRLLSLARSGKLRVGDYAAGSPRSYSSSRRPTPSRRCSGGRLASDSASRGGSRRRQHRPALTMAGATHPAAGHAADRLLRRSLSHGGPCARGAGALARPSRAHHPRVAGGPQRLLERPVHDRLRRAPRAGEGDPALLAAARTLPFPFRLLVVGDGALRSEVERADLGRADPRPADWGAQRAQPPLYQQMDVLVLPSRTTRTWAEKFGKVLCEALLSGVPVIASSSGEIPWVIDNP